MREKSEERPPSQDERDGPTQGAESPLPDVPFMGIAAVLGLLVLVLIGAGAYSIAQTLDVVVVDGGLLAPLVFVIAIATLFWALGRYRPRSYER